MPAGGGGQDARPAQRGMVTVNWMLGRASDTPKASSPSNFLEDCPLRHPGLPASAKAMIDISRPALAGKGAPDVRRAGLEDELRQPMFFPSFFKKVFDLGKKPPAQVSSQLITKRWRAGPPRGSTAFGRFRPACVNTVSNSPLARKKKNQHREGGGDFPGRGPPHIFPFPALMGLRLMRSWLRMTADTLAPRLFRGPARGGLKGERKAVARRPGGPFRSADQDGNFSTIRTHHGLTDPRPGAPGERGCSEGEEARKEAPPAKRRFAVRIEGTPTLRAWAGGGRRTASAARRRRTRGEALAAIPPTQRGDPAATPEQGTLPIEQLRPATRARTIALSPDIRPTASSISTTRLDLHRLPAKNLPALCACSAGAILGDRGAAGDGLRGDVSNGSGPPPGAATSRRFDAAWRSGEGVGAARAARAFLFLRAKATPSGAANLAAIFLRPRAYDFVLDAPHRQTAQAGRANWFGRSAPHSRGAPLRAPHDGLSGSSTQRMGAPSWPRGPTGARGAGQTGACGHPYRIHTRRLRRTNKSARRR